MPGVRVLAAAVVMALAGNALALGAETAAANPDVIFHAAPKPLAAGAVTEDWCAFLGPRHTGVSRETKLIKNFPAAGLKKVWEFKRGTGYASPAVSGERLVYVHRLANEEVVECLQAETGARFWQFKYPTAYQDRYGYNNGPRCSPMIDGDRVYIFGAAGMLHCLKLSSGDVIWKFDVNTELHIPQNFFGVGSTPLIDGELLIVNAGAANGQSVVAFDKLTGARRWACGEWGASYAAPIPAEIRGRHCILVFNGGDSRPPTGGLLCIDPVKGVVESSFPFRSTSYESVNAVQPTVIGEQVFVTASYGAGGALLTITPDFKQELAWKTTELGSHFSTVFQRGGYLYGFDGRHTQNAQLTCLDVKTGKSVWRKQLTWQEPVDVNGVAQMRNCGVGRGSLLALAGEKDGQYLCLGESGELLRLELSPEGCVEVERTRLFDAPEAWSPLVLSHGLLYVAQNARDLRARTEPRLICYDLRGE